MHRAELLHLRFLERIDWQAVVAQMRFHQLVSIPRSTPPCD